MEDDLTPQATAQRLGISRATLYQWLAASDAGALVIHGQPITIDYLQTGAKGQGRIRIKADQVQRLREAMQVRPSVAKARRPPVKRLRFPGIHVELGDPRR